MSSKSTSGKWIQNAINPAHKGMLHKQLGVPQGQKIPQSKLNRASRMGGALGKRARLAKTLSGFHHSPAHTDPFTPSAHRILDKMSAPVGSKEKNA